MKTAILCPDPRTPLRLLAGRVPLALAPCLGLPLLERELIRLADRGAKDVLILASDRPDVIRLAVGNGDRWGLRLKVSVEPRECPIEEARRRLQPDSDRGWLAEPDAVVALGGSPGLPGVGVLADGAAFHAALLDGMAEAGRQRVGAREVAPGVWTGLRSRIDPGARLRAPCWIGERVWVRARATVGPGAVVEDDAIVDEDAEIEGSWVGPRTYVGAMTHLDHSLAWGSGLYDWRRDSLTEVVDAFLLGDLGEGGGERVSRSWTGRLTAAVAAALSSPVVLLAAFRARARREPVFIRRRAIAPRVTAGAGSGREVDYAELNGLDGLARRWPQLWSVARGHFAWVGNRPLTRTEADGLETEFEQLWLNAPIGLVSLADLYGCSDPTDTETRAHSSFYAARRDARLNRRILQWLLLHPFRKPRVSRPSLQHP